MPSLMVGSGASHCGSCVVNMKIISGTWNNDVIADFPSEFLFAFDRPELHCGDAICSGKHMGRAVLERRNKNYGTFNADRTYDTARLHHEC